MSKMLDNALDEIQVTSSTVAQMKRDWKASFPIEQAR